MIRPAKLSGYTCLVAIDPIFAEMGGSNTNCIPTNIMRDQGFVQTYQVGDGPVAVYGIAPEGKGVSIEIGARGTALRGTAGSGLFFERDVPRSATLVTGSGPGGRWSGRIPFPSP